MTTAKQLLRRTLPASARRRLRSAHRNLTFRAAMADFKRHPGAYRNPNNPKLAKLIYGWGNLGWSGWEDFLAGCIDETLNLKEGAIVECGSGLSTLLVGSIATSRQIPHVALEHHANWADDMKTWCTRYKLDTQVVHTPLVEQAEYDWYDTTRVAMPPLASLVLCDGPPGDTRGGRSGAMDQLAVIIDSGTCLLIDDVDRPGELQLTELWAARLSADYKIIGSKKPFARITVP